MDDGSADFRRWAQLMDREALGEALTAEEREFCERFAGEHPAAAAESVVYSALADLDCGPDEGTRALVDGALARLSEAENAGPLEETRDIVRWRRRPRPLVLWGTVAAAGAAAAAFAMFGLGLDDDPGSRAQTPGLSSRVELVYVSGEVTVDSRPVVDSSALLREGSAVAVGDGGACVAMDPGIDVCLSRDSRVRLSRVGNSWRRLDLLAGRVGVQLSPQPQGLRFSIVSDGVWSTAVGTAFTVQRQEASVRTTVLHGSVRVGKAGSSESTISAHQAALVREGRVEVRPVSRSEESSEWALLGPTKLWSNPLSTTMELAGPPDGAEVVLDGHGVGVAPLSSLIPAGAHRLEVRVDADVIMRRDFLAHAGVPVRLVYTAPSGEPPARPEPEARNERRPRAAAPAPKRQAMVEEAPAPPVAKGGAAELLKEARRLMREGEFDASARQYVALGETYPETPEARAGLVSLAQLQLDRLSRPGDALSSLERYLAGGQGDLAQEARYSRIRALRALGQQDAEREAIEEYLSLHPRSFQASTLRIRLEELRARPANAAE